MGHGWKRWHTSSMAVPEIDLLSTAFGLPTRQDIKRAERTAARRCVSSRCAYNSDESSDESQTEETDCSSDDSSVKCDPIRSWGKDIDCRMRPSHPAIAKQHRKSHSQPSSLKAKRNVLAKKSSSSRRQIKTTDQKRSSSKLRRKARGTTSSTSSSSRPWDLERPLTSDDVGVQSGICKPAGHSPFAPSNLNKQPLIHPRYHFPTYIPQYATAHTAFMPLHIDTGVKTTINQARFAPHDSQFQQLQNLQQKLDRARAKVAENPHDVKVHNDTQKVQTKLNNMLNSMVALKARDHRPALISSRSISTKARETQDADAEKENVAPVAETSPFETQSPPKAQVDMDRTLRQAPRRGHSPSCAVRHHLCSGCGTVRSQEFHQKYPVGVEHKPVLNYCSSCREKRFDRGIMDQYHFCFGCGKVRSKGFQKKFGIAPGETIIPNYCGNCTAEVRKLEGMTEQSVVGTRVTDSWPLELGFVASDTIPSIAASTKSDPKTNPPSVQAKDSPKCERKRAKLHLNHISLGASQSAPVSPATSSPFYPGRRLGSAQRRAQRASTPHPEEDSSVPENFSSRRVDYCAPYAEEADSVEGYSFASASNSKKRSERVGSDGTFERASRKAQPKYKDSRQMNEQNYGTRTTPDNRPPHFDRLHYTDSSGGNTVRCQPFSKGDSQHSSSLKGNIQYQSKSPPSNYVEESCPQSHSGRFSKNAFESNSSTGEVPFEKHASRRKSPLADFGLHIYSTSCEDMHQEEANIDQTGHSLPFPMASSRGAFGRDFHSLQSQYAQFEYHGSESQSRSPDISEGFPVNNFREAHSSQHSSAEYSHSAQHNPVNSFASSANSHRGNENTNQDVPNEGAFSRSVFTDYSRSTNNPYYTPRRPHFPSCDDFKSTWNWRGSGRQSNDKEDDTARRYSDSQFDGRVPEPIVEEPLSPPSSPIQQTMLLEFDVTHQDRGCSVEVLKTETSV